MRALKTYQGYDQSSVTVGEELRKSVRFRFFNSVFFIGNKEVEVFDVSLGGLSLKMTNQKPGQVISGFWEIEGQKHEVKLEVKRQGTEFVGAAFLSEVPFLEDILNPSNFSKEKFKMVPSSDKNLLVYKNQSENICLGFKVGEDKQISSFLFCFQNVFLSWKEKSVVSSGVVTLEESFEFFWENEKAKEVDSVIDSNKIKIFLKIIQNNSSINQSLKDWVKEKLSNLYY